MVNTWWPSGQIANHTITVLLRSAHNSPTSCKTGLTAIALFCMRFTRQESTDTRAVLLQYFASRYKLGS